MKASAKTVRTLLILGVLALVTACTAPVQQGTLAQQGQQTSYQTQTDDTGAVVIAATPTTLAAGSEAQFALTLDTHSGDIPADVAKTARLVDDTGTTYDPVAWSGGSGGHHVEGMLTFPALSQAAQRVTLTLPAIDTHDSVFTWEVIK
jgi:hypothetical protein